jgi:hypothetical protein
MALFDRLRLRVKSRLQFIRAGFAWAARDIHAGLTLRPIAGGAPEGGDGGDGDGEPGKTGEAEKTSEGDKTTPPEDEKVTPEDDWETKARKNETRASRAERELKEEQEKREAREETEKSDHQKAIDKAKEEARSEALTEAQKERRADKLELAVTRLAGTKLKLGSGDDAEEARFADADDAQVYLDRAIRDGEIDEDSIFDEDGKVDAEKVEAELVSILKRKPHLREGSEGSTGRKTGQSDARKGEPASGDLDSMSVEDHAKRKYGSGK